MQDILPLCEAKGSGEYLFLGHNSNYEGYTFHCPKGKFSIENKIGKWNGDNTFTFINPAIKSFKDWKQVLSNN
jgi:hypothetical protein